jgi:Acetyltransferases
MNLIKTNVLSEEQTKAVRALEQICRTHDGLKGTVFLSNEINFSKEIDSFYLLYEEKQLVSFVALFIPMPKEAEVSAFTLPEYRQKGCFSTLLQSAGEELKKAGISRILFVNEPQSTDAVSATKHYGANYEYSEYLLTYNRSTHRETSSGENGLRLERAVPSAAEEMAKLSVAFFHDEFSEALSMIEKSLQSPEIECWCAFLGSRMVGLCNVNLEGESLSIFGLGIDPEFQGKGYGRQMLGLLLDRLTAREEREITLEVSSTNEVAYRLYITSGFEVKTQFDYSSAVI